MAYKDDSKQWFETGDYPTQVQFAQVFDWLRWKDEALAISDITNLQNILNGLAAPVEVYTKDSIASIDFNYRIAANYLLEKIIVQPSANCVAVLYDTDLSEDIITDENITGGKSAVWTVDLHAINDRHISLKALPAGTVITFIKRKVTL